MFKTYIELYLFVCVFANVQFWKISFDSIVAGLWCFGLRVGTVCRINIFMPIKLLIHTISPCKNSKSKICAFTSKWPEKTDCQPIVFDLLWSHQMFIKGLIASLHSLSLFLAIAIPHQLYCVLLSRWHLALLNAYGMSFFAPFCW